MVIFESLNFCGLGSLDDFVGLYFHLITYNTVNINLAIFVDSGVAIPGPTRALARASTYLALASKLTRIT